MRIGITVWGEMISPVLDAAERLLVFETSQAADGAVEEVRLGGLGGPRKVAAMAESGIEVLICGAVTRGLLDMLEGEGIQVVPWISGRVADVLAAFAGGRLGEGRFSMPGCCGGRRRRRGGRGRGAQRGTEGSS